MKVFITYSRTNKEPVNALVEDLHELSHTVWYDFDLRGGQSWWDNILDNIRQCDIYVFVMTVEALESTACRREMDYAKALNKTALPVLIGKDVSIALLPRYLSNVQFVDYTDATNKNAVFALIKALNSLPASSPLPDPLPAPPPIPISYLDELKDRIDAQNLDKNEQLALLSDLKIRLADSENKKEDVLELFHRLRKHEDLLAFVAAEIDDILRSHQSPARSTTVNPAPPKTPVQQPAAKQPISHQLADAAPSANAAGSSTAEGPWSNTTMAWLVVGSLFIPIMGVIAGIIGLNSKPKKTQGAILLVIGIINVLYVINEAGSVYNEF